MLKEVLIGCVLIAASITDIKKRQVPVYLQLLLCLMILMDFKAVNLLGGLWSVPFFIANIRNKDMGGGDVKTVLLLGMALGFIKSFWLTVIALSLFVSVSYILKRRKGGGKRLLPFLPYLTIAYVTVEILEVLM